MTRALILPALLIAAACSPDPTGSESAMDFANRVGAADSGGVISEAAPMPNEATGARDIVPAGVNSVQLERLGNIGGIDLGPRAGGCTFSVEGQAMLVAVAPADRSLPGKATVRTGGQLHLLDALPGGIEQVRSGTTFTGEGFSATLTRTGPGLASLTITDAAGTHKVSSGNWVCS